MTVDDLITFINKRLDEDQAARSASTSAASYATHDAKRAELLAAFRPGQPCALCGQPMASKANLDLAHNEDRTGWKGLSHRECNRATNKG